METIRERWNTMEQVQPWNMIMKPEPVIPDSALRKTYVARLLADLHTNHADLDILLHLIDDLLEHFEDQPDWLVIKRIREVVG